MTGEESVHLVDWPENGSVDEEVLSAMSRTRKVIEQGLALRMTKTDLEDQVKVRQPLGTLTYDGAKLDAFYESIIAEEVNVKEVRNTDLGDGAVLLDKTITPALRREGLMREVIRNVQAARKNGGLRVDDRINLGLQTDDEELQTAITEHLATIQAETLAIAAEASEGAYRTVVQVEGCELIILLEKA